MLTAACVCAQVPACVHGSYIPKSCIMSTKCCQYHIFGTELLFLINVYTCGLINS